MEVTDIFFANDFCNLLNEATLSEFNALFLRQKIVESDLAQIRLLVIANLIKNDIQMWSSNGHRENVLKCACVCRKKQYDSVTLKHMAAKYNCKRSFVLHLKFGLSFLGEHSTLCTLHQVNSLKKQNRICKSIIKTNVEKVNVILQDATNAIRDDPSLKPKQISKQMVGNLVRAGVIENSKMTCTSPLSILQQDYSQ